MPPAKPQVIPPVITVQCPYLCNFELTKLKTCDLFLAMSFRRFAEERTMQLGGPGSVQETSLPQTGSTAGGTCPRFLSIYSSECTIIQAEFDQQRKVQLIGEGRDIKDIICELFPLGSAEGWIALDFVNLRLLQVGKRGMM